MSTIDFGGCALIGIVWTIVLGIVPGRHLISVLLELSGQFISETV